MTLKIATTSQGPISETVSDIPIRLIAHNIRYATKHPFKGEAPWSIRCPKLCAQLRFTSTPTSTFICLQEVLHSQLLDILTSLNSPHSQSSTVKAWSYIGVGRDNGKTKGEYSPIFYRPSIWNLESWETKWLSETPGKPSKGWDASSIRLVTIGNFKHVETGTRVVVMSTHLDNDGAVSRQEGAKLILKYIDGFSHGHSITTSKPPTVILGGDFNSEPSDGAYKTMTSASSSMEDVALRIPKEERYGNELTFTSFGHVDNKAVRIDFIFVRKGDGVKCGAFAVLGNRFDDGVYLSDHRAVVADLVVTG